MCFSSVRVFEWCLDVFSALSGRSLPSLPGRIHELRYGLQPGHEWVLTDREPAGFEYALTALRQPVAVVTGSAGVLAVTSQVSQ